MTLDLTNLTTPQYNFVTDKAPSIILSARAGSGKTFALEHRIRHALENNLISKSRTIILAFNKTIQQEWEKKELGIQASTTHSLGFKILRSLTRTGMILPEKQKLILSRLEKKHEVKLEAVVKKALFDVKRQTLFNKHSKEELIDILNRQVIKNGGDWGFGHILWEAWCDALNSIYESIDYDDMLYGSLELLEKNPSLKEKIKISYDLLIVDEMQDLSFAQISIMKLLKPESLWCVGDPAQNIFAFTNSSYTFIKDFAEEMEAKPMLLNETRRCSKEVVDYVNATTLADFKASSSCKKGLVDSDQKNHKITATFDKNTVIVSRWNNTLMSVGMNMLLNEIPFYYRKSIAEDVARFINRIDKRTTSLREVNRLAEKQMKERERELAEHNIEMTQYEQDMWGCALHLTDRTFQAKFKNVGDLTKTIRKMGKDKSDNAIQLSTIHASKGLEWENVIFVENIALMETYKRNPTDIPDNIEKNVYYVACTRSKNKLFLRTAGSVIEWTNKYFEGNK